jgi:glycolate oxidase FAD binding subunit
VSIERDGGDVVLSTRRLDQVLEHEAGDLTAIVEAGIRVRDLNTLLAGHGQMLALDPPGNPTIGACVAANLSGPRRHRYGTARDLVIGVTVVLADGTIASSGGKVVKNVAGYDLGKVFCGSEGRFGLIARVALRLHPRPESARTLTVPVASPADAQAKARAILRAPLAPSAVDVVWPGSLAVLFEGARRAVDEQLAAAQALVGGAEDSGSVWKEAEARQARSRGRLLFAPGELAATLGGLEEAVVRVAAGVAYVPSPVADPRDPAEMALAERVRAQFDPQGVLA